MEQSSQSLWSKLSEDRARERTQLKIQGLKDAEIDKLFWDRARLGNGLKLGETALHAEIPENPHWPDVKLPDDPPELKEK